MHTLNNEIYKDPVYGDITKIFYVLDDIQFGIDSNGNWLQLKDNNKIISRLGNDQVSGEINDSILPLLEINIKNFKEDLGESLRINNISAILAETFPYELIILNGLYSESDWWVNLALDWLMGISIKNNFNYALLISKINEIKDNKAYDQNVRHKAKKALARYK